MSQSFIHSTKRQVERIFSHPEGSALFLLIRKRRSVVMESWNKGRNVTVVTKRNVLTCAVTPGEQGDRTMTYRVHVKLTPTQT